LKTTAHLTRKIFTPITLFLGILFLFSFVLLLVNLWPICEHWQTLFKPHWNPEIGEFGIISMLAATIFCAVAANFLIFPVGLVTAFCIRFFVPQKIQSKLLAPLELLAAVPSLVFGMIGLAYVGPQLLEWFQGSNLELFLKEYFSLTVTTDANLFTGSLVLALLLLPYTVVFSYEASKIVTPEETLAADSLGLRRLFFITKVALPAARTALVAAFFQCLSRALGEAVALSLVIGRADVIFSNQNSSSIQSRLSSFVFSPGQTFATKLAGPELFLGWSQPQYRAALLSLVLILFIITSGMYVFANAMQEKSVRK
jgi:phosphate transport system permease protein